MVSFINPKKLASIFKQHAKAEQTAKNRNARTPPNESNTYPPRLHAKDSPKIIKDIHINKRLKRNHTSKLKRVVH